MNHNAGAYENAKMFLNVKLLKTKINIEYSMKTLIDFRN